MENNLFREKSLKKISSPDELNSCFKVISPSVWLAIAAIAIILIGGIIWGVFGRIETKVQCVSVSDENKVICYISEADIDSVSEDMTVIIDGKNYIITDIDETPIVVENVLSEYSMNLANYTEGEYVYPAVVDTLLTTGNYESQIVTDSISAFSFIWNVEQ